MESSQAWIADGPQHIIRFFLRMVFDERFLVLLSFLGVFSGKAVDCCGVFVVRLWWNAW
jgi:hypothetical protein